jgi:hypothetical protein
MKLLGRMRHSCRESSHLVIGEHVRWTLILFARDCIPPGKKRAVHRQLLWRKRYVLPPDYNKVGVRVERVDLESLAAQVSGALPHCRTVALLCKVRFDSIENVEKVVGVLTCICDHLFGQRPDAPVGHLQSFVGGDAAVLLKQVSKGEGLKLKDSGCLACVEDADEVQSKVTLQPIDVRVRSVHDFCYVGIGEALVEDMKWSAQLNGVN